MHGTVKAEAIRSCQTPVKVVQGEEVTAIEGLTKNGIFAHAFGVA